MSRLAVVLLSGCAISLLTGAALADPPSRVGRISEVEGDVSLQPPEQADWAWADRNYPVTAGESFWTGDDGRIELQIGGMEIRGDNDTELDVLELDYGDTRLALAQGSIDLRLWRLPRGGVTISTPAGDVEIDEAGVYRVDVGAPQEDGTYPPVELTVFEGDAGAPGPEGFAEVQAGDAALIYAGYDPEYIEPQDAAVDDWARSREASERWDSQSAFAASMTGYETLAEQGQFVTDPAYGTVWFPASVPDDWAPYRFGHWAWVAPWGYTWIDDEPWGFAPFHYGRWIQIEGRWGWVAGQPAAEAVYAPALVVFFGLGASIGWAPLAPDEVYRPSFEVSESYLRRVNTASVRPEIIQNITINTTQNFTHYRNAGAAVMVGSDIIARGARIQTSAARTAPGELAQAAPAAHALPPPAPQARAGGGPTVNGAGAARAVPPPSRLDAVRASVKAQPRGSTRPPEIAGATIAPPKPPPAGGPAFVAPAQKKNPELQARRLIPPPAGGLRPRGTNPALARPMTQPTQRPPYAPSSAAPTLPEALPPNVPGHSQRPSRQTSPYPPPSETNPPANTGQGYERSPVNPREGAPASPRSNRLEEAPYQPPPTRYPPSPSQRYERSPTNPQEGVAPSRPGARPGETPYPSNAPPSKNAPLANPPQPKKETKPKPDEKQPPP